MPKLTERGVASAKPKEKVYRLSDGGGLLLEVRPGGGRAWLYRYMLNGKRRDMGLGAYPAVGLAEARRKARVAGETAKDGQDPLALKEAEAKATAARQAEQAEKMGRSFKAVAERLVKAQSGGWTSGKTLASWRLTLDRHAYPVLADIPVADVTRDDVVKALGAVWSTQPATAQKLQRRIASVLDYAAALGWRSTDNPATGRVLRLTKALPRQTPEQKQPALPWQKVPAFLTALEKMEGVAALALRFAVLTVVRNTEVRMAVWSELDFTHRIWTIPAQRMKGGRAKAMQPHRVPLTDAMLDVLAEVAGLQFGKAVKPADLADQDALKGKGWVFPSPKGLAFTDAALGACIRRMNEAAKPGEPIPWRDVDDRPVVPHGFRRSFRSWVDDTRPAAGEAAEKALAHEDANTVRAAYRGSDMLEQRRPLMEEWSRFCCPPTGEVVRLTPKADQAG
jgi:integrase